MAPVFSKNKIYKAIKIVSVVIASVLVLTLANIINTNDMNSIAEFKAWCLKKYYSTEYKGVFDFFVGEFLLDPARYDKPPEYWDNIFEKPDSKRANDSFYYLKVWYLENDLKRKDLTSSYLSSFNKTGDQVSIGFKQRRDLPAIQVRLTAGSGGISILDMSVVGKPLLSMDMNRDGKVDFKDVEAVRSTRPYLKNEFTPDNQAARDFRTWGKYEKDTLIKLVNKKCNESHKTWDSLFNDRFIKCDDPPTGIIGKWYWCLPGNRPYGSKSIGVFLFIVGFFFVLLPSLIIFYRWRKDKSNPIKKSKRLKLRLPLTAVSLTAVYLVLIYFVYIPLWRTGHTAIYNNDLATVKKYWWFINPENTKNIVFFKSRRFTATGSDLESRTPLEQALYSGSLDIAKFLINEKGYTLPEKALPLAARSGSLETVKYLLENFHLKVTSWSVQCALDRGFMDVGQYLLEKDSDPAHDVDLFVLAESDRLDLFKENLNSNKYTPEVISYALSSAIKTYNNRIATYILNKYPGIENVRARYPRRWDQLKARKQAIIYDNVEILSILLKRNSSLRGQKPSGETRSKISTINGLVKDMSIRVEHPGELGPLAGALVGPN